MLWSWGLNAFAFGRTRLLVVVVVVVFTHTPLCTPNKWHLCHQPACRAEPECLISHPVASLAYQSNVGVLEIGFGLGPGLRGLLNLSFLRPKPLKTWPNNMTITENGLDGVLAFAMWLNERERDVLMPV